MVLGDHVRSLVLGMEQTFAQLRREVGGAVDAGMEDARAEIKAELQGRAVGRRAVLVAALPERLERAAGRVVEVTASHLVVDIGGRRGVQILEKGVNLTEQPRDWAKIDTGIEVGHQVLHLHL